MKRGITSTLLSVVLVLSVTLAGCIFEYEEPGNLTRPATSAPTRTSAATGSSGLTDLPALPDFPPPPAPDTPYPLPPGGQGSRTGQLGTGAEVPVGTITVGAGEPAQLIIKNTQNPLNGLEINVPADSYRSALEYSVSYAPITSTTFKHVEPVSPLITVDNGGGYSSELMTVKIPVKLTADQFAMGFYYNAKTGQLEGLPLLDLDASSVTVATRHFSSFFVSAIEKAVLEAAIKSKDINSRFRPGTDDWQFPNAGSYIEPGGHCAGQSITAMWYFVMRPDGSGANLWKRYDRNGQTPGTPELWEDDSQAYRFVSTVQRDIDWNGWQNKLFNEMAGKSDTLTLSAFAYAILATGEPQYVGVRNQNGEGHALVVYRIDSDQAGIYLCVADPNLPGNNYRTIDFDSATGKFDPYNGSTKFLAPKKYFETVRYVGKSAIINWNIIDAHWRDLKAGKAGDSLFPKVDFAYLDEKGDIQDYKEGMVVTQPNLYITPLINDAETGRKYFRDGNRISCDPPKGMSLVPGRNVIGTIIYGLPKPDAKEWEYVDFVTLDIVYLSLAIDPTVVRAQVNQDCVFTASLSNPPAGVRYDWLVNGTRQQTGPSITFKYRSAAAGTFDIGLKVFDSAGKEMGMKSASAIISAATPTATAAPKPTTVTPTPAKTTPVSRLSQLQKKTVFSASVGTADGTLNYRMEYPGSTKAARTFTTSGGSWSTGVGSGIKITWSGSSFSGTDTITSSTSSKVTTRTVNGTVSADGNTVTSLTFSVVSKWPESENKEYQVVAQNISLASYWGDTSGLQFISGAQAASAITKVTEKTERAYSASTRSFTEVMTLTSIDWKSSDRNSAGASFG